MIFEILEQLWSEWNFWRWGWYFISLFCKQHKYKVYHLTYLERTLSIYVFFFVQCWKQLKTFCY